MLEGFMSHISTSSLEPIRNKLIQEGITIFKSLRPCTCYRSNHHPEVSRTLTTSLLEITPEVRKVFNRMFAGQHVSHLSSRLLQKGTVFISDKFTLASEWTVLCKVVDANHERGALLLALYEFEKPEGHQVVSNVNLKHCRADFMDNRNWTYERRSGVQNAASPARKWNGLPKFLPLAEEILKHRLQYPFLRLPLTNRNFIFMRFNYVGGWISSMEVPKPVWVSNSQIQYACLKDTGELLIHYYIEQRPLDILELHPRQDPKDELRVDPCTIIWKFNDIDTLWKQHPNLVRKVFNKMDPDEGNLHFSSRFLKRGRVFASKKFKDELECTIFIRVLNVHFEEGRMTLTMYKFLNPVHDQALSNSLTEQHVGRFMDNRNWMYDSMKQFGNGVYLAERWSGLEEFLPLARENYKDADQDCRMSLTNRSFLFMRFNYIGSWKSSVEEPEPRMFLSPKFFAACLLKTTGDLLFQNRTDPESPSIVRLSLVQKSMEQILLNLNIPEEWKIQVL